MKSIVIVVLIFLTSCKFSGLIDEEIKTENISIDKENIIGKWKLDKFSYQFIDDELDGNDSVVLILNSNSSFETNLSSLIFQNNQSNINNAFNSGTWELKKEFNSNILVLNFEEKNRQLELRIFQKENELQLWYFLGDPDSGERVRFLK